MSRGNLIEGYTIYRSDSFAGICVCVPAFVPALVYTQASICAVRIKFALYLEVLLLMGCTIQTPVFAKVTKTNLGRQPTLAAVNL
jgi:hypothetical protein